jgi:F-type H+-transporting ATPase subunit a
LPQLGQEKEFKEIIVAQGEPAGAGEHAETGEHAGATATTTHEGHAVAHEAVSPLAEYSPYWYSGMGFLIALLVLILGKIWIGAQLTKRNPSKGQLLAEQAVASMNHFCEAAIGHGGKKYAPFVGTIFAFILCSNLCGVIPLYWRRTHEGGVMSFTPAPTANLSMTLALGFIVFVLFNYVGIKANGFGKYMAHFAGPIKAMAPFMFLIEIVGVLVRPISLAMRLFGNVFGEEMVIAILIGLSASILPWFLPLPLHLPMLLFGVFGSIVQAGVFAILTCSYIALAIGDHGDDHAHHDNHNAAAHGHEDEAEMVTPLG